MTKAEKDRYESALRWRDEKIAKLEKQVEAGLRELKTAFDGIVAGLCVKLTGGKGEVKLTLDEIREAIRAYEIDTQKKGREVTITVRHKK